MDEFEDYSIKFKKLIALWVQLAPKGYDLYFDPNITPEENCCGYCSDFSKLVVLDYWYVRKNSMQEAIEILLHEIAHAWTPAHFHDEIWAAKAIALGADPNRIMPCVEAGCLDDHCC